MAEQEQWTKLPRGPHHLTREEVESSQRRRLTAAMTEVVGERGYVKTSVAEVIKRAGVSRATFYVLFNDKEQCFLEGLQSAIEDLGAAMAMALLELEDEGDVTDTVARIDALLRLYLHVLSTSPQVAKTFLVEVFAAGPEAIRLREHFMTRFNDLAVDVVFEGADVTDAQRFAIQALIHSMSSMVTLMVGAGEIEKLPTLREPFLTLIGSVFETKLFSSVVS